MTVMSESVIHDTDTKKASFGLLSKSLLRQTYGQAAFLKQKAAAHIYTNQNQKNRSGGLEGYCLQSQTALLRIVHPCFHLGVNVHTQMNLQTYINLLFRDHQQDGPLNLQIPITFKGTKQHLLHIHEGEGKQSKPSMKQGAVPALGKVLQLHHQVNSISGSLLHKLLLSSATAQCSAQFSTPTQRQEGS